MKNQITKNTLTCVGCLLLCVGCLLFLSSCGKKRPKCDQRIEDLDTGLTTCVNHNRLGKTTIYTYRTSDYTSFDGKNMEYVFIPKHPITLKSDTPINEYGFMQDNALNEDKPNTAYVLRTCGNTPKDGGFLAGNCGVVSLNQSFNLGEVIPSNFEIENAKATYTGQMTSNFSGGHENKIPIAFDVDFTEQTINNQPINNYDVDIHIQYDNNGLFTDSSYVKYKDFEKANVVGGIGIKSLVGGFVNECKGPCDSSIAGGFWANKD